MGIPSQIWQQIDPLVAAQDFAKAIQLLEGELQNCDSVEEVCRLARTLADLYRFGLNHQDKKAANYAFLAGQGYVRSGRVAQAVSVYHWLKGCPGAEAQAEQLHRWIARAFSATREQLKREEDDLPPPTPYVEMQGFVTFEQSDVDIARDQWKDPAHKNVSLFSLLRETEVARLCQYSGVRELPPGGVLFREGDRPLAFYIVADGEMELESSIGVRKFFQEGEFFGELALFGKIPRTATLKTEKGCKLLEFSEDNLKRCFAEFPTMKQKVLEFYHSRLFCHVAAHSFLFRGFTESELEEICDDFTFVRIPRTRILMDQGEDAHRFFLMIRGECEVVKDGEPVARLGSGQFVGEIGLIRKQSRTAKVIAMSDCEVLECDEIAFDSLCERFPKLKASLVNIAELRDPEMDEFDGEITDKIVVD